jgi:hypothetical protein
MEMPKIIEAHVDPRMRTLDLTVTGGDRTENIDMDLTNYEGFGFDTSVLIRTQICECAAMVFFPDFPAPGAMISLEPFEV